ncbi:coagulation factor XII isoform X2 [Pelodiscus sinensis]|uniref:coagulation factor XII isoform X2 n=1 Tax=Pelodiscus sinensis TaxID=13735 RepID=UPI003F6B8EEC
MARLLLLALLLSPGAAPPDRPAKPPRTKGEGTAADGEPCHFPFRYQRKMHHSCLWGGPHGPRPWCATTPNYDWDHKWTLCGEDKRVTDPCKPNPCENGGACTGTGGGYRCVCPAPFHGRHCQKACATNPCANGGLCVAVKREQVCSCPSGYLGPFCDTVQGQACYSGRGLLYRGMANTTLSGAQCLPWDSDLLAHEFSTRSMPHARRWGLGSHAFCRNPDNDTRPWCYMLREGQLLWEFCSVPPCEPHAGAVEAGGQAGAVPTSSSASPAQACGQQYKKSVSARSRIVGGLVALAASHPYLAALHLGQRFCGGTLIASCWVLTAAHCLQHRPNVSHISVGLGRIHYNSSTQGSAELGAQSYVLHENYSQVTQRHDIALVRLREQAPGRCAELSRSILPACLPSPREPLNASRPCEIAGWGHLYEGAEALSGELQEAVLPIVPHELCCSPGLHGARVTADMLCAGYLEGGTDACQGDSGGPLVCEEQGRATLRGIISWGVGCGEQSKPGVYTNVARYLPWIQAHLGQAPAQ